MSALDPHVALGEACVYKITGPGGKLYIGKTVRPLKVRLMSHAMGNGRGISVLQRAIKKHGRDEFTIETILVGDEAYCFEMEPKLIAAYGTLAPDGYNVGEGGEGWTSAAYKRHRATPEGRAVGALRSARAGETNARRAACSKRTGPLCR